MDSFNRDESFDEGLFHEAVINVVEEHSGESGGGREHTNFSDLISEDGEFLLEWGFLLVLLDFHFELAVVRVLSDCSDEHSSGSFHDHRT